jgi:hypothetical protein
MHSACIEEHSVSDPDHGSEIWPVRNKDTDAFPEGSKINRPLESGSGYVIQINRYAELEA